MCVFLGFRGGMASCRSTWGLAELAYAGGGGVANSAHKRLQRDCVDLPVRGSSLTPARKVCVCVCVYDPMVSGVCLRGVPGGEKRVSVCVCVCPGGLVAKVCVCVMQF